jgi:2-iminobutanoate/2-iminopropanoate deaminase
VTLKAISTDGAPSAIGPYSQGIAAQAEQAMENIKAILEAAGLTFANVAKTTCLLADINDFDAFNAVYTRYVSDPKPARATYAVKDLPRGALVEVEAFAVRD